MSEVKQRELVKIHINVEKDVYYRLWNYIKRRYIVPYKKLHIVINEALREYLDRHEKEL